MVWSIECTEHLVDKQAFFRRAAGWLRPGGRIAIGAWLAAEDAAIPRKRQQVEQVCQAFLCPSLASFSDSRGWMQAAGLTMEHCHDWTARVAHTWEICRTRSDRLHVERLAGWVDRRQAEFVAHFATLLAAYQHGAMQYGYLVASRPAPEEDISEEQALQGPL